MASGDTSLKWGSAGNELTWSSGGPASLADGSFTSLSDELSIGGLDPVIDVLVAVKVTPGSSPGSDGFVQLYAVSKADGANYPGDSENYINLGRPVMVNAASAHYSPQFSLAEAFGGVLPAAVKLALENQSGAALAAGADATEVYYQKVYAHTVP